LIYLHRYFLKKFYPAEIVLVDFKINFSQKFS